MDRGRCETKEKHPRETTNIFSKFSFFYIIKLFKKGYTKGIESDDIYEVLPNCRSKELGDRLEEHWQTEKTKHKNPSLCRALIFCFGKTFFTLGFIQLVFKLTLTIWSPQAQSKLISYFNPNQSDISKNDAIYYACVVIGLQVFSLFFTHNFSLYVLALGLGVKAAVTSLIYRKSLKLNCKSLSEVTVGKITTLLNKDVEIFQSFVSSGINIWVAFVQTGMICYLIYNKIGVASWAGVAFFFVVLPLQMFIGKLAYNFRLNCCKKTDERLEITQEVLSAIKIIKMYTWEKYFEKKICDARKEELKKLMNVFYARVWISVIGSICSKMAFFIFLVTYIWMNNNVTAEIVYYILSCFGDLQSALSDTIPSGFAQAAETYAIAKRCEEVLTSAEMTPKLNLAKPTKPKIELVSVSAKICNRAIFENVSLTINPGLYMVVGHVGSGKSTFLKTIMQDCDICGDVNVFGTISYASQEPWLFPSTIKNNILFGEEYCKQRYQKVLKICCLDYDLALIDNGDNTIIGDSGVNLSKGQQARVNLARAVYKISDIYLLDDCLASLDAHVSDQIFEECIRKFLRDKICIFVTNNFDYVPEADEIITVHEGTVTCDTNLNKRNCEYTQDESEDIRSSPELSERARVYREVKNPGKVTLKDYYRYISYGGGIIIFSLIMVLFIAYQGAASYSEKLLSEWVTLEQNATNLKEKQETYSPEYEELYELKTEALTLYCSIFAVFTFLYLISAFVYYFFVKTASKNMHRAMIRTIMNSRMKFFDTNFIGNVLTRFSKDCCTADEYVPFVLMDCLRMIFTVCGVIILLTSVDTVFLVECVCLIVIAYLIKRFCQPTGRNLQRLHVIARSPMVGHVNSTLTGLTTVRANCAEEIVKNEFDRYQDQFTSAHYMLDNTLIALSYSLELFCTLFIASIIIQFLVRDSGPTVGDVGLAITQSFSITSIVAKGIRSISDTENLMTSVERILEYISLEQEDRSGKNLKDWPKSGSVNFRHVSLNYGQTKQMLNVINLTIKPQEKLGIVGRTGAGKSSIISTLFRLYETQGKIFIDDFEIEQLSLDCLRSNISVIPQDPFLFSATIRDNLDPLKQYTDSQIWQVLDDLRLKNSIESLNIKIDKGSTLSAGQKQLLCLARIILHKNKIVILDEATANVDEDTDKLIREAVQKNFAECTVIIIAHRLSSILDCQKVIVMNDGRISEYDDPKKLMQNKSSFFNSVVK